MTETARTESGLDHVIVGDSTISLVAGETGGLTYRGFDISELTPTATYEAVVHLLLFGEPPETNPPRGLQKELAGRRGLPPAVDRLIDDLPPGLAPLDALRTGLSALGDGSFAYPPTVEQGFDLIAKTPTVLARYVRRSAGLEPLAPRPQLPHAENYLWMLTGTDPTAPRARALEQYLILLADHGMNASTFALRVVLSTNSDLISAVTAAVGALKGPLHGGAPSRVSDMLDAIGSPENAEKWLADALANKQLLYGFGHRAYKTDDPRALQLKRIAREVADPKRLALAEAVETAALAALRRARPQARLYTNVEYYGAVVLEGVGLPRELFTPTFAVARTAGWAAHALEQTEHNRLIRPDVRYTGTTGRRWPERSRPHPK